MLQHGLLIAASSGRDPCATSAATSAAPSAAATSARANPNEAAIGREDRRRWLPVRSLIVASNRARQSVPAHRNVPVADIARPWIDDVGGSVCILGVAGAEGDFVAALEIHLPRILVPGRG